MLGAAAVWLFLADLFLATLGMLVVPAIVVLNLAFQRRGGAPPPPSARSAWATCRRWPTRASTAPWWSRLSRPRRPRAGASPTRPSCCATARIEAARVTANFEAGLDVLPAVTVALLVIGVWRIDQGAITAGTLVGLINLFALLIWPLRLIGYVLEDMPRAVAGYERVAEVLAEPLPAEEPAAAARAAGRPLELVVDRVGYGYRPAPRCCTKCRSRSRTGATVALVGPTGSGQVDPGPAPGPPARPRPRRHPARRPRPGRAGRRRGGRERGHRLPGAVPVLHLGGRQHPARPRRGVRGTSRFVPMDGDGVVEAARLAQADEFVTRAARRLRHRGRRAGGDPVRRAARQRVALARALAGRPGCWSWTTPPPSVDPVTEAAILGDLEGHLPATTTVVVASRLATIALADRVLYLEDGRLADGDHGRLDGHHPGYARLVRAYERAEAAESTAVRHASEVGAERIPAMALLRRGLAASPELRKGGPHPGPGPGGRRRPGRDPGAGAADHRPPRHRRRPGSRGCWSWPAPAWP